jgi:putative selenium metabolism hydrolase
MGQTGAETIRLGVFVMRDQIFGYIDSNREKLIESLQQMVQIPSPTYQEGAFAKFVERKLKDLGMETFVDPLGDVTGVIEGRKDRALFLLNTHLDHAEPGDMPNPYSGEIVEGSKFGVMDKVIYGRGVNGQKASLAGMVFATKAVLDLGLPIKRGFAINAVVMEECGGHLGPKYLMEKGKISVHWVLSGEHTDLKPIIGHRGMINLQVCVEGKGSHAAAPQGSSSALTGVARIILALERLKKDLPKDETFGQAIVSLNKVFVKPNVANVIPDRCDAVVDARHPASLPREEIISKIQSCISEAIAFQEGLKYTAEVKKSKVISYTGVAELSDGCMFPFYTPGDHPLALSLLDSIEAIIGNRPQPGLWTISSETGYFSTVCGLPVVAFGPGEDRFTHNRNEHVKVEDVLKATKVYADMIAKLCL